MPLVFALPAKLNKGSTGRVSKGRRGTVDSWQTVAMCGRYAQILRRSEIREYLRARSFVEFSDKPRFNTAPATASLVAIADREWASFSMR